MNHSYDKVISSRALSGARRRFRMKMASHHVDFPPLRVIPWLMSVSDAVDSL